VLDEMDDSNGFEISGLLCMLLSMECIYHFFCSFIVPGLIRVL